MDAFIEATTDYLGARHPDATPLPFDGAIGNRAVHVRKLKAVQKRLGVLLAEFPRQDGDTPQKWISRLRRTPDEAAVLNMIGHIKAVIDRMDDEAELERRRHVEAENARHEAEVDAARRRAMPDADEVSGLVATIGSARDGERLLAQMFAALNAHKRAQEARTRLAEIFTGVDGAREMLRAWCETMPKAPMKRPKIDDAPSGAVELAKMIRPA
jgi:hypothetical protein